MAMATAGGAAPAATSVPDGSSVREAFALMSTLIYPKIPLPYLDLCARILQRKHLETVFEERSAQLLCAFPPCGNRLSANKGKFRISLARKEIYDASHENQFCSQQCMQKARVLMSKLASKPPQLVPSVMEVFGTNNPNPKDFADDEAVKKAAAASHHDTNTPAPHVKTVWSKTSDLGIVERQPTANPMTEVVVPPALEASTSGKLKENTEVHPPDRNFPETKHAMLIEGYTFPAHKQKLAKKVERLLQKEANKNDPDLVVSDSDESEGGGESDVSSTGSFDLSDFDEEEVINLDDLPLFSNVWAMFSEWITHDTTLVVAGREVPDKSLSVGHGEKPDEAVERQARLVFNERWNALSLMMRRPMTQIALKLQLPSDRQSNHRIDSITRTFWLREAIDTRSTHSWTCIAAILLLVAHDKRPHDVVDDDWSTRLKTITKLDAHELQQLLSLFYEVRNDSDIALDTEDRTVSDDGGHDAASASNAAAAMPDPICRKCRRITTKCACGTRAAGQKSEFSTAEVEAMFQDALVLRDEYEELLEQS